MLKVALSGQQTQLIHVHPAPHNSESWTDGEGVKTRALGSIRANGFGGQGYRWASLVEWTEPP